MAAATHYRQSHLHHSDKHAAKRNDTVNQQNENISESKISSQLRLLYDLPPITRTPSINVIEELRGILRNYGDDEESSVDAVKSGRESIHRY